MYSRGAAVLKSAVRSRKQPTQVSATAGHSAPHTAHLHTLFRPPASTHHGPTNAVSRILTQFISSAIARGPSRAAIRTFTRAVLEGSGAHRPTSLRSITQSLSFPARSAVSPTILRPQAFARTYIPRAPTVGGGFTRGPRAVANVGLGSARNFSSGAGRPLFQNLVQNVPIAMRAICEVDLDSKIREEKRKMWSGRNGAKTAKSGSKYLRVASNDASSIFGSSSLSEEEYGRFFASPEVSKASEPYTTTLSVTLSPPVSEAAINEERQPLPFYSSIDDIQLNPWDGAVPMSTMLQGVRAAYGIHNTRVARLFAKLDEEDVWSRGVSCSALAENVGFGMDLRGPVRTLDVRFEGWTQEMVLQIVGDSALEWCQIRVEAHRTSRERSPVASEPEDYSESQADSGTIAFVMPTLDISFTEHAQSYDPSSSFENAWSSVPNAQDDYGFSIPTSPMLTPLATPYSELEDSDLELELESEIGLELDEGAFSDSDEESWYPTQSYSTYPHRVEGVEDTCARSEWSRVFEGGASRMNDVVSLESMSSTSFGQRIML